MTPLSDEEIATLRALLGKMTPLPWEIRSNIPYSWPGKGLVIFSGRFADNETVGRWENEKYGRTQANVDGIVALVNAAPRLLAERQALVERIEARLKRASIDAEFALERDLRALLVEPQGERGTTSPIPMLLFCPTCHRQHVDAPAQECPPECHNLAVDPAGCFGHEAVCLRWTNPPHKSHLCHGCGNIWRPADVATNGVAAIATRGSADTWERGTGEQETPCEGILAHVADVHGPMLKHCDGCPGKGGTHG